MLTALIACDLLANFTNSLDFNKLGHSISLLLQREVVDCYKVMSSYSFVTYYKVVLPYEVIKAYKLINNYKVIKRKSLIEYD